MNSAAAAGCAHARNATRKAENFCFSEITFSTQLMVGPIYKNHG